MVCKLSTFPVDFSVSTSSGDPMEPSYDRSHVCACDASAVCARVCMCKCILCSEFRFCLIPVYVYFVLILRYLFHDNHAKFLNVLGRFVVYVFSLCLQSHIS